MYFDIQGHLSGLAWDGTNLWCSDVESSEIAIINPNTGAKNVQLYISGLPTGLTWDGTYLWYADFEGNKIYRISP